MKESDDSPRRLGDFKLVRELGRGGMGVVFEAWQLSLSRKVALKVMNNALGLTPKAVQRFEREAQAAAKLHHTNIVPVYATGEADGAHFYAMELIDGPSLDRVLIAMRRCDGGDKAAPSTSASAESDALPAWVGQTLSFDPLATGGAAPASSQGPAGTASLSSNSQYFDNVARMIADVADALGHAHQNGVIHRDIKPSNMLLSSAGRLSLNDFGLARMLEQPGMTMTGEFVGTPAYMSPEQIAVGRIPLDHRTDIYSLGATLYELLTLHAPFRGERRDQVLSQILQKEPKPPRTLNRKVPIDLETICLKAMDKDPDRRYQTAKEMADDLRRYVNRFAISARRAGRIERAWKWAKRHPGLSAALAAICVLGLIAGYFAYAAYRGRLAREEERRQHALEKALLEAMSGSVQAEDAIFEAEQLKVAPDQIHMLRGVVAYYRADFKQALKEAERAVLLAKDNVAARALMVPTFVELGLFEEASRMSLELNALEPRTAEDSLFLGLAQSFFDPARGLQTLDAVVQKRESAVAFMIRGQLRMHQAISSGSPGDAERAIDDLCRARALAPRHVVVLQHLVMTHLTAAHATAREHERAAHLAKAKEAADALKDHLPAAAAVLGRYWYFAATEEIDTADKELVDADAAGSEHPSIRDGLWAVYFRRGEFDRALDVIRRRNALTKDEWSMSMEAFARAQVQGREEALKFYDENIKSRLSGITGLYCVLTLRYLGRDDLAQQDYEKMQRTFRMPWRGGWYEKLLAYSVGHRTETDEARLREAAGASRLNQCEAHFFIGMSYLGKGNRSRAREHFQKSIDTGVFIYGDWECSRALLERLKDESWPQWIAPAK